MPTSSAPDPVAATSPAYSGPPLRHPSPIVWFAIILQLLIGVADAVLTVAAGRVAINEGVEPEALLFTWALLGLLGTSAVGNLALGIYLYRGAGWARMTILALAGAIIALQLLGATFWGQEPSFGPLLLQITLAGVLLHPKVADWVYP